MLVLGNDEDAGEIKVFWGRPRGVKCVPDILTQVDCPRNRFLVKMLMTSPIMIAKRMRRMIWRKKSQQKCLKTTQSQFPMRAWKLCIVPIILFLVMELKGIRAMQAIIRSIVRDDWQYQNGWIFGKVSKNFNPNIYNADFGFIQGFKESFSGKICNMIFRKWGGGERPFGIFLKTHPFWCLMNKGWIYRNGDDKCNGNGKMKRIANIMMMVVMPLVITMVMLVEKEGGVVSKAGAYLASCPLLTNDNTTHSIVIILVIIIIIIIPVGKSESLKRQQIPEQSWKVRTLPCVETSLTARVPIIGWWRQNLFKAENLGLILDSSSSLVETPVHSEDLVPLVSLLAIRLQQAGSPQCSIQWNVENSLRITRPCATFSQTLLLKIIFALLRASSRLWIASHHHLSDIHIHSAP